VERCYTEALVLAPDDVELLVGMAKQWQLRGQPSTAMKYYKRVRDLDPGHAEAGREIRLYLLRKKKDQQPTPTTSSREHIRY
jgi:predicted TPR repeat methyltransferase